MARSDFGASIADYVVTPTDGVWAVASNATITFWDDPDAGTQYTDLLDGGGSPITQVVADEYGFIPDFQGPDAITGMWADVGGSSRSWIQARGAGTGGGGGGSAAFTSLVRVVASATAPANVRAAAAYVCDGTADQVQIQQAITDAQNGDGGGIVMLSVGDFNLTAPIQINGTGNEDDPDTLILQGCGEFSTVLKPAFDTNGIVISNWAQCHIRDLGIVISGAGSGIVSTSVTTEGDTRSFWDSSFRNLRINGSYTPTWTGWAMDLDMPFRSVFDHIEIEGTRNGIHLYNNSAIQNAGDCDFRRMFIEIVGADGVAIHVESVDGNMNQNNFSMVEAGAGTGGTGTTGILIDGAAGGASQRFWGTNLEQFATLVNVDSGESNVFDLNYVTCRDGEEGNRAFVCGTAAWNNTFSAKWVNVAAGDALSIIEDANTSPAAPNIFERMRIEANSGSSTTYTKVASTVFRDIIAFLDGGTVEDGLLQYPLSTVNNPSFRPDDHGLLSWTDPPSSISGTGFSLVAGQVYLSKLKIMNRSTVVSNIWFWVTAAQVGGNAGQNFVGLYNSSGTLLVSSADITTALSTTGEKTVAITPQTLAVGNYYVAFLANHATTPPSVAGGAGNTGVTNVGLTTAASRFLNTSAGNTSLPASITLSSQSKNIASRWAGVS